MSYNAAFNSRSNTVVFNDTSNYQIELQDNCRVCVVLLILEK